MAADQNSKPAEILLISTESPHETERLGECLGTLLRAGDLICLSGSLGTGKTCLTRGLARAWGALEAPNSPTFTLINEYHRIQDRERFYHADCYRLVNTDDARTTGIEDFLDAPAVLVIEWPERINELLPLERLTIEIEDIGMDRRVFRFIPYGVRAHNLVQSLRAALV